MWLPLAWSFAVVVSGCTSGGASRGDETDAVEGEPSGSVAPTTGGKGGEPTGDSPSDVNSPEPDGVGGVSDSVGGAPTDTSDDDDSPGPNEPPELGGAPNSEPEPADPTGPEAGPVDGQGGSGDDPFEGEAGQSSGAGQGSDDAQGGAGGDAPTGNGGTPVAGSGGSSVAGAASGGSPAVGDCENPASYDALILCEGPVAYWAMNRADGDEPDLTGNGLDGSHEGGSAELSELPNGDVAMDLDGESQYVSVPSHPSLSIPTTGTFTWEAWIQPAVLEFPNQSNGYVDWMGKCADYSPTCEWEARMYGSESDRCNRLSAYAFNPDAGLGSGAYFQTECGTFSERDWIHVVGQYTLLDEPDGCDDADDYPGSIEIWVNGVNWNQSSHGQTGCMSQYQVSPEANDSPLNIGTMAGDAWFQGAIGKVAIYDYLLDETQIAAHYEAMTGNEPTGNCDGDCTF